jgi:hypothetical protein
MQVNIDFQKAIVKDYISDKSENLDLKFKENLFTYLEDYFNNNIASSNGSFESTKVYRVILIL